MLAHANSHRQRGNGNRTEAVFSFKFGSKRGKVMGDGVKMTREVGVISFLSSASCKRAIMAENI